MTTYMIPSDYMIYTVCRDARYFWDRILLTLYVYMAVGWWFSRQQSSTPSSLTLLNGTSPFSLPWLSSSLSTQCVFLIDPCCWMCCSFVTKETVVSIWGAAPWSTICAPHHTHKNLRELFFELAPPSGYIAAFFLYKSKWALFLCCCLFFFVISFFFFRGI